MRLAGTEHGARSKEPSFAKATEGKGQRAQGTEQGAEGSGHRAQEKVEVKVEVEGQGVGRRKIAALAEIPTAKLVGTEDGRRKTEGC